MQTFLIAAGQAAEADSGGGAFWGFLCIGFICWICYAVGKGDKPKGVDFSGSVRPR